MKILRLLAGIIAGLFTITLVAESVEFLTVKLLSGQTFDYLKNNQQEYFTIRNRGGVLAFKIFYTFIAALSGGYVLTLITKEYTKHALVVLISIQVVALLWAGFFSELSSTGPAWMWIMLTLITPMGIFTGHKIRRHGHPASSR